MKTHIIVTYAGSLTMNQSLPMQDEPDYRFSFFVDRLKLVRSLGQNGGQVKIGFSHPPRGCSKGFYHIPAGGSHRHWKEGLRRCQADQTLR